MPAFADTMPFYMKSIPKTSIGVYQTDKELTIFSHPEANSNIVKKFEFTYEDLAMPDKMFAILINEKKLGFLYVTEDRKSTRLNSSH